MKASVSRHWRVPAHASLVWHCWDTEYVFHHALSNNTHRLSEIPGQLVVYLATTGEHSARDLAQHFLLDETDTEEVLTELASLDFVTCRS